MISKNSRSRGSLWSHASRWGRPFETGQTKLSDQEPNQAKNRKSSSRPMLASAALGALVGMILVVLAWIFELLLGGHPWTPQHLALIHRETPLLFLIDSGPLLGAFVFGFIGYILWRLREARDTLEERVRLRTLESTWEKARTSAILDAAADGIVTFSKDGRIIQYNNAARWIFGYHPKEVVGRDIGVLIPAMEHGMKSGHINLDEIDAEDVSGGNTRELTGLRDDGTELPLEADISRYSFGDEESFTAIIRDISERRRQERLKKSLLEMTEAVNNSRDLDSLYESINESLRKVTLVTNLSIALVNDEDDLDFVYIIEEQPENAEKTNEVSKALLKMVIERKEHLLVNREDYERVAVRKPDLPRPFPFASWLGVPLINMGQVIGAMDIYSYEEGAGFTDKDTWILDFVSGQIANAIDREQARESLRQSEKRYRRMVEEAGDIVYTTDIDGNLTYVNPPAIRLTGYREDELLKKNVLDLIDEDYREEVWKFYRNQVRRRARDTVLEFPILTKDQEKRWIEQNTTLLFEENRPSAFQSIVHDTTERRRTEAALREREERFRSLSASSPIGIFQLDASGQCIYVNQRFESITGLTSNQCLGAGWLEAIHPEERRTFRTEWIFGREDASSTGREIRLQHTSGQERWVNVRWAPTFDKDGRIAGYVGTFEDISRRKRTERINQVLYEISESAQNSQDIQEFFSALHHSLSSVIDTTNFYVALYDEETRMISFPYAREEGKIKPLSARKMGKGLTGYVIRKGKTVLLDEKGMQELYNRGDAQLIGQPAKNWLGVPLVVDGKVMGTVIIQSYTDAEHYSEEDVQTMTFVSSQIAAAIRRKQQEEAARDYHMRLAEAHQRIKDELALAARIQQSRLPKAAPDIDRVQFSWRFNSCEEVAGDMFNFVRLSDHEVGIYLFDVSGHGVAAALLSMSLSRALTAASDGSGVLLLANGSEKLKANSPSRVAELMNERFPMNLDTNQYFTLLYGILDTQTFTFRFVRGGHPAPILVSENSAHELDVACGPAIGIVPRTRYEEHSVQLQPGDRLLFFTDGLEEANNQQGEEFGVQRLLDSLARHRGETLNEMIGDLVNEVDHFSAGTPQHDDITIVGFHISQESGDFYADR